MNRAATLDLTKRNGGYMVAENDAAIAQLIEVGLITVTPACDGYVIARSVIVVIPGRYHYWAPRNIEGRFTPRVAERMAA